jgi:signal transduction histidine kinase
MPLRQRSEISSWPCAKRRLARNCLTTFALPSFAHTALPTRFDRSSLLPQYRHTYPHEIAASIARNAKGDAAPGVSVHVTGERPAIVAGRCALLTTAVEEVVRNALEAMPQGGRLIIETEECGNRCRLWVRDTGPGLPAEVQDHLFEPFLTTKSFGHLGLGLALASELVRAQDGTLAVSSSPGLGTTVTFSFPAFKATEACPTLRRKECQFSATA